MLLRLLLILTLVPAFELYLLLRFAQLTSPLATFLLIVVSGILGSILLKREWAAVWQRLRHGMSPQGGLSEGRLPTGELQDGLMLAFAAALLLTPGILTDALGFMMLFPVGRKIVKEHFFARLFRGFQFQAVVHSGGGSARPPYTSGFGQFDDSNTTSDVYASTRPIDRIDTVDAESVTRRK